MTYRVYITQFKYYLPGTTKTFSDAYERGLMVGFPFVIEQLQKDQWIRLGSCTGERLKWQEEDGRCNCIPSER